MKKPIKNLELLDEIVEGYVDPHIYGFTTELAPEFLKVGDTSRAVSRRLAEWRRFYPDLKEVYRRKALADSGVFFRDHSVHRFLERKAGKKRLQLGEIPGLSYSREFFRDTQPGDVDEAIGDILASYEAKDSRYAFYDSALHLPAVVTFARGPVWQPRPNQQRAVDAFSEAVKNKRTNLLMYAVMRFGKSFTSLLCAQAINAQVVVVVSAKSDVKMEWKKAAEQPGNFEGFTFLDADSLERDPHAIANATEDGAHTAVIFLTLQDLQGEEIKEKHEELFTTKVDLLIVDETHFGARAEQFGRVLDSQGLAGRDLRAEEKAQDNLEDSVGTEEGIDAVKVIDAKVRLHLSGTPYRILMGSEFEPEDIVAYVQFSDIVNEQKEWDSAHLLDEAEEWDNPYFGFPEMVRFAFNPNESSRKRMEQLRKEGTSFALSALLAPQSIRLDRKNQLHKRFIHEKEILDLLRVIDGTQQDSELFGFLDYDRIKEGKMCRHLVMVLPFCASCDAMEELLKTHSSEFKNLSDYQIINISGVEAAKTYPSTHDVKETIAQAAQEGRKTLTLTVNRMLTGSTVEQWDTMLFMKDTASPQEYDQAIFRLQNQYVAQAPTADGGTMKVNLKPQTLLVDFDPARLFRMQEQKALIYNANTDKAGNTRLRERIDEELAISPVITLNHGKMVQVSAANVLEAVANYNASRSLTDEIRDIPTDLAMLFEDPELMAAIRAQAELGSREGLEIPAVNEGEGDELDLGDPGEGKGGSSDSDDGDKRPGSSPSDTDEEKERRSLERKLQTYHQRLLFFAMLSPHDVDSLEDIIDVLHTAPNDRIARNIGLKEGILRRILELCSPFKLSSLDYAIQNASDLARDERFTPLERAGRALEKFNRLSVGEVRSPSALCDEVVGAIPLERFTQCADAGVPMLDIASKFGEFAVALYRRFVEAGVPHAQARELIYAVPTSTIAYEFTRKFYDILDLNVEHIATPSDAYYLVEDNEAGDGMRGIHQSLFPAHQSERVPGEEETPMKFGAIVGNPPYQEPTKDTSDASLYWKFMNLAYAHSDVVCLVTKGAFLFNQGKTPKEWNEKMLADPHLRLLRYEANAKDVFKDVGFKGGVAITLRNAQVTGEPIGVFYPIPEVYSALNKVLADEDFAPLTQVVELQNKFNLPALFDAHPEARASIGSGGREKRLTTSIFNALPAVLRDSEPTAADAHILGLVSNKRFWRSVRRDFLDEKSNLGAFKVVLPKSNATGAFGERLSSPLVLAPGEGFTQSFISIGAFDTREEAEAALKYVKTRFVRALLSTLKVTQDNNKPTWAHVPRQDFSAAGWVDWSQSVDDIDQQLFTHYGFTAEEQAYLREHVQPMD